MRNIDTACIVHVSEAACNLGWFSAEIAFIQMMGGSVRKYITKHAHVNIAVALKSRASTTSDQFIFTNLPVHPHPPLHAPYATDMFAGDVTASEPCTQFTILMYTILCSCMNEDEDKAWTLFCVCPGKWKASARMHFSFQIEWKNEFGSAHYLFAAALHNRRACTCRRRIWIARLTMKQ